MREKTVMNVLITQTRPHGIIRVATVLLVVCFLAENVFALGGYWKPIEGKSYTVRFTDEAKNVVLGEFKKTVRWEWDKKGNVTITKWDEGATFMFKDKEGKEHKIHNATIKVRILDLAPGMTGKLKGNINAAAYAEQQSIERTYLEWATALEKSINSGNPNMLNRSLDSDMIVERATKGLPIAGVDMASFSAGLKSGLSQRNIGWELCEAKRRLGSFRLLRLEKADDGYTALFRLSSYDNFDYIQFSLSIPGGNVVITDIEYWCRGSRLSEVGRQMAMLLLGSQATQPAPDAEISQWFKALPLLKEMVFMIQANRCKEAMEAYAKMPDVVRRDKSIMMHRIAAAKGISDQEYLAAVEDFRKLFPTDPAIDFIVFQSRLITGKYEEARKAIDRLEKRVGTDSLLDCLRANVFSTEGNLSKAKAIASEVTKAEPELPRAYWELVLVSLIEKDFRETSRLLSFLESSLHAVLPDIETLDGFAEFTRSSEYRRWKETKAVAEKEEAGVIKRTQPKHNKQRK